MIKRFITASILLVITLSAIFQSGIFLTSLVTIAILLAAFEHVSFYYAQQSTLKKISLFFPIGLILAGLLFSTQLPEYSNYWNLPLVKVCSLSIISILILEWLSKKLWSFDNYGFISLRTLCLFGLTTPYFLMLRKLENGLLLILFVSTIIWLCDSSALFVGKKWGKNRLTSISPNKTVEGSIGGLISSILIGIIVTIFTKEQTLFYVTSSIIISILAQISDLHESLTKRHFNVKDSSQILPGHGGVYDRLDSFILVIPTFYFWVIHV